MLLQHCILFLQDTRRTGISVVTFSSKEEVEVRSRNVRGLSAGEASSSSSLFSSLQHEIKIRSSSLPTPEEMSSEEDCQMETK
jgi:hypothetical protein